MCCRDIDIDIIVLHIHDVISIFMDESHTQHIVAADICHVRSIHKCERFLFSSVAHLHDAHEDVALSAQEFKLAIVDSCIGHLLQDQQPHHYSHPC